MHVNKRVWLGSIASIVALMVASVPTAAQQPKNPNIVIILMDNLGYGWASMAAGSFAVQPLRVWGKWHLGSAEDRMPTNQGFDEWYGIPRTYDEAMWPSVGNKQGWDAKVVHPQHIYEARKGEKPQQAAGLDVDRRRKRNGPHR